MRTVVAHFRDRASAGAAYDELQQRGFPRDAISIVERGPEAGQAHDTGELVTPGQGVAVGGIAGVLIGVGVMLIPGVGPILAVGPLAAALAGAVTGGVTGAVTGGIVSALVDAGVDEDAARYYDELVREGGVLLTVSTEDLNVPLAREVLHRHGGDLRDTAGAAVAGGTTERQTTGTDPGAVGFPDPRSHIGDDPGVVGTPYHTNTGMTGFDQPARPETPLPDPTRASPAPAAPEPRRPGGAPII
ncbi:MAG TPA: hypothetical protein VK066_03555 [Chloroflexota bacterium]|nr:hypothetical protein [Chloroflexota bacterium]